MGHAYFATDKETAAVSPVPVDWIGRCRGIVVIVRAQLFQEAKEQIVQRMAEHGFLPVEISIERLRGGA